MRDKIAATVPSTAEQVHVRQILLYNEDVAKTYYAQLQAGTDFDELAAQVDPVTRGDLGWFPRGYLPEQSIEAAAFALEPGQMSAILPSEVGFHILKLLAREADRPLAPDALRTLQSRVVAEWVANRRQASTITLAP
jgi:peptidyl-prolyl cis-trans isomerase C